MSKGMGECSMTQGCGSRAFLHVWIAVLLPDGTLQPAGGLHVPYSANPPTCCCFHHRLSCGPAMNVELLGAFPSRCAPANE